MAGEMDWTLTWTADADGQTIADAGSHTGGAISNDTKLATEVAVKCAYGGTATEGVVVYLLREGDTAYEDVDDAPFSTGVMEYAASTTYRKTFTVAANIPRFKVLITNDSGAQVTVDIDYRQAVAAS